MGKTTRQHCGSEQGMKKNKNKNAKNIQCVIEEKN